MGMLLRIFMIPLLYINQIMILEGERWSYHNYLMSTELHM
jgi:hypothetical protein